MRKQILEPDQIIPACSTKSRPISPQSENASQSKIRSSKDGGTTDQSLSVQQATTLIGAAVGVVIAKKCGGNKAVGMIIGAFFGALIGTGADDASKNQT